MKPKRKPVPHLFAKLTIIYCVLCGTAATAYCIRAQARGMEMATILTVALGFFGGELLLLCLKTILKDREEKSND